MKKYTEEHQIWIDFEAMVAAETEEEVRAIAENMPVKVLRKIWDYKAPRYLTSDTRRLGLGRFRKADWVNEVVELALNEHAEKAAEQAKARAVSEGLPVSSDGTVMFKVGAVYIKRTTYQNRRSSIPPVRYKHWTIVGLTSCYAYVRNLDGTVAPHTIKRRREGDNVEKIYLNHSNGWLEATDIAVEAPFVPETPEQEAEPEVLPAPEDYSFEEVLNMDNETFARVFKDYIPCHDAADLIAVLNEEIDAEMTFNSHRLINRKVKDYMPAVTRLGDICTGHGTWPPRPSTSASPNVYANSIPVHRRGDSWAVHCNSAPSCHAGTLAAGSSSVYVNGRQLGRIGDPVSCGSSVASGSSNVFAGG